jgi:folate-binding protein YgfZ
MVTLAHTSTDAYQAMTEGAAVVDRSERGKLALTGADAKEFLHGQVTNDVEALEPGSGCYAAFLTHKGKMLGDLRILETGDELLLDCERSALQDLFTMIRRYKVGRDVELHKRTVESGLLSLIGPDARRIAGATDLPEVEHAHRPGRIGGAGVRVIATDLGVDVLCEAADTEPVAAALIAAGAVPAGDDAAEVRRVETGRPRYGVDLDDTVIPQEAGLNDRAVSFEKGCYVGQETVARLYFRGKPNRHLRGLKLSGPAAAGEALRLGEREVGRLGSVVASPRHGPIALALVRREAQPGETLAVGDGDVHAEVVELPFAQA